MYLLACKNFLLKNTGVFVVVVLGVNGKTSLKFIVRERLRTHKVFTKDQCFYFNYHKFSIKSYVFDVY